MNSDLITASPTLGTTPAATSPQRQSRYGLMDWTLALEREFLRIMHTNPPTSTVDNAKPAANATFTAQKAPAGSGDSTALNTVTAAPGVQSPAPSPIAERAVQSPAAHPVWLSAALAAAPPASDSRLDRPNMTMHVPMGEGEPQVVAPLIGTPMDGTKSTANANLSTPNIFTPPPLLLVPPRMIQRALSAQASGQLNEAEATAANAFSLGASTSAALPEERQVHVERGPDGFTLWIRDAALAPGTALPLAQGMAREFGERGLRIAAIHVNGERVLSAPRPNQSPIPAAEANELGQSTRLNYYL